MATPPFGENYSSIKALLKMRAVAPREPGRRNTHGLSLVDPSVILGLPLADVHVVCDHAYALIRANRNTLHAVGPEFIVLKAIALQKLDIEPACPSLADVRRSLSA